jgi:A/G-specific adenine glycosylase
VPADPGAVQFFFSPAPPGPPCRSPSREPALTEARSFAQKLVRWQKHHGRHDLPWQNTRDPYRIWVSEIMLQQTQVAAVIPYFERFIGRFPDVKSLARASTDAVMRRWAGLGYYSRARNLHAAAKIVAGKYAGRFPGTAAEIEALPGIGRSTAAAIAVFAYGERSAILDGNVKRVLCRAFGIDGSPTEKNVESELWRFAESLLPKTGIESYTQGLMDLGATLCTRTKPACDACPLRADCVAHRDARTAELPARRARKPVPAKSTAMLILIHRGNILLEQRPPSGVWGGLWSLPESPLNSDWKALCASQFGLEIAAPIHLAPFKHSFTHFTLDIQPVLCKVERAANRIREPGLRWIAQKEIADAALPAPVKSLLLRVGGEA